MRIATTEQLIELNNIAKERNYNRILSEQLLMDLSWEGRHVSILDMVHDHKGGVRCEPHFRVVWMTKLIGSSNPTSVQLDCDIEKYLALEVVD